MSTVNPVVSSVCGAVVALSDRALQEVVKAIESKNNPDKPVVGIKVFIRKAGCMGNEYCMDYVYETPDERDAILLECSSSDKRANIFIDKYDVMFMIGTEIDYEESEMKSGFVFRHPNEKGRCGCGSSFSV